MGCIARLGCLAVLLVGAVVGYLTRDLWKDKLPWRTAQTESARTIPGSEAPGGVSSGGSRSGSDTRVIASSDWAPLTEGGAKRTRDALQKLSSKTGPVFVTLSGSDVASYIFLQIAKQMPASTDSFAARVDQDHIRLRARMKTSELGSTVVGVLGALLSDRERVEMGGTLRVIGTGLAEFRVSDVKVHDIGLPDAMIGRLVKPLVRGPRPPALHENGLPISIPSYIGDVRVSNGKITLYKNVQ
jgi:hypothetical protein